MPPPMVLPMTKKSGSRPHAAVAPPGPTQMVCVSSITSKRAVGASEAAQFVVEAGVGHDDPDVGQRRLGQHAGDLASGECGIERGEVVERNDDSGGARIERRAEVAGTVDGAAILRRVVANASSTVPW